MSTHKISLKIRRRIIELCYRKKASHIGGALSIVDILTILYATNTQLSKNLCLSPDRDRLFYSKGHACTALYSTLEYFEFFDHNQLDTFTDNGSIFTSHVNHKIPGVELSTGSLGHALSVASGVAFSAKRQKKSFQTYCILSDGELNEGSNWEATLFAAHHNLTNLTIIIDYNKWQSFGRIDEIIKLESLVKKFEAFNCTVFDINGHDHSEIQNALSSIVINGPKVILANTIKGKGVSFMEDKLEWHYKSPTEEQFKNALVELGE